MAKTESKTTGKTRRRRSSSGAISENSIEQATSLLEDLPEKPKENTSLREAISLLQDPITTALDRGYSYDEISAILREKGVKISASSLRRYLATARRERESDDESQPSKLRQRRTRRSRNLFDDTQQSA